MSDMTGDGDTLLSLLSINLCDENEARRVAESLASTIKAELGKSFLPTHELAPGIRYAIHLDEKGAFQKATFELDPSNVFHCVLERNGMRSWKDVVVLDYKTEVLTFKIRRDLVHSILAAGEGRELARELVHIFQWDIDFRADPRNGDECRIVFERRYADDRPDGYGQILYAVYDGKRTGKKTACYFPCQSRREYYDEKGVELKKNFLRAPLDTLRVTSPYGMRIHPVLNIPKFHTGVDYGAPTGTPVYAIANGTVTFQGCGEAYGLYVCIRHEDGTESRYSHLSRILVKKGDKVKQRKIVGLVGSTGRSTGPHLFFEIIENGKRINPRTKKLIKTDRTVPHLLKDNFKSVVNKRERVLLEKASGTVRRTEAQDT